jgi:hypothetical protein
MWGARVWKTGAPRRLLVRGRRTDWTACSSPAALAAHEAPKCHCERGQRRTATAASATALTARGSLGILVRHDAARAWDPGDGGYVKVFCATSASQLGTLHDDDAGILAVGLGAPDDEPGVRRRLTSTSPTRRPGRPCPRTACRGLPERVGTGEQVDSAVGLLAMAVANPTARRAGPRLPSSFTSGGRTPPLGRPLP